MPQAEILKINSSSSLSPNYRRKPMRCLQRDHYHTIRVSLYNLLHKPVSLARHLQYSRSWYHQMGLMHWPNPESKQMCPNCPLNQSLILDFCLETSEAGTREAGTPWDITIPESVVQALSMGWVTPCPQPLCGIYTSTCASTGSGQCYTKTAEPSLYVLA